ncbi:hypothetical protein PVK06_026158 [Gossypium arboreum]|uniref:DUF4283 domain-containing protein n=1 Tax=Gossypium arboreum TaxID=29729 RepID=A0ABR0NWY7_GOSAR|nr:hypothetical protein PVK06_026158 [Gossypium arboreum]
MEGDATNEVIDGISSITFSDRVHQYIGQRIYQIVILKLLGRRISYLTMSSKLQAIWKTKRPIQILDLENDYFSVKFHENEDYLAALSGGLWTILGQYLMVRPWTPTFMTDQSLPKNLMVWICLPGLLEEMYSKSLLKLIYRECDMISGEN